VKQSPTLFETIPVRSLAEYERFGCATEGCAKFPVCRFEAGNVGSYFCDDCGAAILRQRLKSTG
jgi:hypothetical protein